MAMKRREFMKRSAGIAAGVMSFPSLVCSTVLGGGGVPAASERVALGHIGVGVRGTAADSGANDVINGRKPVPLQYMSGYRNTFEVNAKFQVGKIANVGTLTLSGSIAAGNLLAAADTGPVTVTCGGQQFIASAGEFAHKGAGRKTMYRGTKPTDGSAYMATGQIDLDKCTFKLMFKDIDVSGFVLPETIQLEFDQFDATADFSY